MLSFENNPGVNKLQDCPKLRLESDVLFKIDQNTLTEIIIVNANINS